jgi:hypothetical protein
MHLYIISVIKRANTLDYLNLEHINHDIKRTRRNSF